MMALVACIPIFHLIFGIIMIVTPDKMGAGDQAPPLFIGWLFALIGGIFILIGWALALCIIITGRFLASRRRYLFCLVIAAIECIFIPFGTVLGVFTIIVLTKLSVKQLFLSIKF
jgi:hypothetical protein